MRSVCVLLACRIRSIFTRLPVLKTRLLVSPAFQRRWHGNLMLSYMTVAEKLKQSNRNDVFEQETMEELEDEEGNVYNRKTYEDLKKQGLI